MTKTRQQKEEEIEVINEMIASSDGFIVFGFKRVSANDMNNFRGKLEEAGADLRVVKRTLLDLTMDREDITLELSDFAGQTGFLAFEGAMPDIASIVYDFFKGREEDSFEVFCGFNLVEKEPVSAEYLERIGALPSREVLLGQVVGAVSAPIRGLMYALQERSKAIG